MKRAIVREARRSLDVDLALYYSFEPSLDEPSTYSAAEPADVEYTSARPPAEIVSLLHRVAESRERYATLLETDALGRLQLDTFGAKSAIAAPLVEHETTFGVLILVRRDAAFEPHYEEGLAAFADQAAIALAQANLFAQLGERNEELAEANVALRERGDVIRDIVYALSHDLRTPLSASRMTMQQALEGAYGELPPAYRDILRRTIASNGRVAASGGNATARLALRVGRSQHAPRPGRLAGAQRATSSRNSSRSGATSGSTSGSMQGNRPWRSATNASCAAPS